MASGTRAMTNVYLLGSVEPTITGSMLPSRMQVLKHYLYLHLHQKMATKEAAAETVKQVSVFWDRARIPMQKVQRAREKVIRLHDNWKSLKKNENRQTEKQQKNENDFLLSLDRLFDIAHENAMSMITIIEDREFLQAQREEVRRGTMSTTRDVSLDRREERQQKEKEKEEQRVKRSQAEQRKLEQVIELASDSTSSSSSSSPIRNPFKRRGVEEDADISVAGPSSVDKPPAKRTRSSKKIMNPQLSAAMDRTNISNRAGVHILAAVTKSLGHDPKEMVLNRESFRRDRMKFRAAAAKEIKNSFRPLVPLVVHWDGKMVKTAPGGSAAIVDRLSILVSGDGVAKLLGVPVLPDGTGQAMANAVMTALEDWGVTVRISALSFDTTASNTGISAGACIIIEQRLNRTVLHLACRHHILELICEKAFTTCIGSGSGPDIALFKRFQTKWKDLDKSLPEPFKDKDMPSHLLDHRDDLMIEFSRLLEEYTPREDYRELLELSLIVLGGQPKRGIRILCPGALHRARWMAKIIYAIKIYLFRNSEQVRLTAREKSGIRRFVTFSVSTYVVSWFNATSPATAPAQDLQLLTMLVSYPDKEVAKATATVFGRHLWYLSERLVALAFFDDHLTIETKREMVKALKEEEGSDDPSRRATVELSSTALAEKTVASFVTSATPSFFEILRLDAGFLALDPTEWPDNPGYTRAASCVKKLHIVNDFAERGIALMQDFNLALTKDEDQKQFIFQVVEKHRREYPDARKSTVTSN